MEWTVRWEVGLAKKDARAVHFIKIKETLRERGRVLPCFSDGHNIKRDGWYI